MSEAIKSRRRFLVTAAASAGSLAVTMPAAASLDDSELLRLEKEIFAAREAAAVYDDEVIRVYEVMQAENDRLESERSHLSEAQRWAVILAMPESKEYERLAALQEPHQIRQEELTTRMFSIPATTAEGRRAKVLVLLGTLMTTTGYTSTTTATIPSVWPDSF